MSRESEDEDLPQVLRDEDLGIDSEVGSLLKYRIQHQYQLEKVMERIRLGQLRHRP